MGLLDSAEGWLDDVQADTQSVTVVLRRGGSTTEDVAAVVGGTDGIREEPNGETVEVETRDYLIKVAAYAFDGTAATPTAGDLIDEEIEGETRRFEVLPFGDEGAARHTGPGRRVWRVHTKRAADPEADGDRNLTEDELAALLGMGPY